MKRIDSLFPLMLTLSFSACQDDSPIDPDGGTESEGDAVDEDDDGYSADVDCDDQDPDRFPGAEELCNEIDDDCDGLIDNDAVDATTQWADSDGDGFGNPEAPVLSCDPAQGHVDNDLDCDDQNDEAYPGRPELCDGADNNCNLEVDEDIPSSACETGLEGICDQGGTQCVSGEMICAPLWVDVEETCNGVDDDCDGEIDEAGMVFYADIDNDGHGDPLVPIEGCGGPGPDMAWEGLDCNDNDEEIHPDHPEICGDGKDNNCDGSPGACELNGSWPVTVIAEATITSTQVESYFGYHVEAEGDFNGDGIADLLVGAPKWDASEVDSGAIFVFFGPWTSSTTTDDADLVITGSYGNAEFGTWVSAIPDVNDDGSDEIAVGNHFGWVVEGPTLNMGGTADYFVSPHASGTQVDASAHFSGGMPSAAGQRIEDGRDFLGTGTRCLVIASPRTVVELPVSGDINMSAVAVGSSNDYGGEVPQVIDDINGDGLLDLAVGRPHWGGLYERGRVDYYFGPQAELPPFVSSNARLEGEGNEHMRVGMDVTPFDSMDGDIYSDHWVTVHATGPNGPDQEGSSVHLVHGAIDFTPQVGSAGYRLYSYSEETLGQEFAPAYTGPTESTDFNGDGFPDLLMSGSGSRSVKYGPFGGETDIAQSPGFGILPNYLPSFSPSHLTSMQDINSDGLPELVVGFAREKPVSPGDEFGVVYVIESRGGL